MKSLFKRHRDTGGRRGGGPVGPDDLLPGHAAPFSTLDRSCCCPARPVVMAVLPATATRPAHTDLLLCGHHFHVHEAALQAAGASVYDVTGALISGPASAARAVPRQSSLARAR